MRKILILVEGQSEETFVRELLDPYLQTRGSYLIPTLATTKRVKSGPHFKGGIVSYGKVRNDINRLLGDTSAVMVTTLIDYYGLPNDFPGRMTIPAGSCFDRVAYLEKEFEKNIGHPRFLPYLSLHEFEAMMFVDGVVAAGVFAKPGMSHHLSAIKARFSSPEEIDEQNSPSKRLLALFPEYQKPLHGPLVTLEIGLDRIRKECPHFSNWLQSLEKLVE